MAEATEATRRQPVMGVKQEDVDDLLTLTTDVNELSEGALADITAKIIGLEIVPGGELKTDPAGREFITSDQLAIHLEVDDFEEKGLENGHVMWYMNLPKVVTVNGVRRRAAPGKQSDYGLLLQQLESFGISGNPANAARLHMKNLTDIVGLHFRRVQRTVAMNDGRQRRQYEITEIYGIDNDLREQAGLKPVKLAE